jgi:hypothetical protein
MSLRIRRGTEAQRATTPLDLGEIVWTTDANKLYVGDGVNNGGKNILATSAGTGLIWNAATQRLDFNGSGTGIVNVQADATPSLGGNLNLNNRNITGTGNITITGTVNATQYVGLPAFRLSNDLTPQLGGNLNLNNRDITGIGDIDITGTIRNSGTVTTGEAVLTAVAGSLTLTNVNTAQNLKIRRTLPVAGNHTDIYALSAGAFGTGQNVFGSRGTLAAPTILQPGDIINGDLYTGYNGTTYQLSSAINHGIDPFVTVNSTTVPGMITLSTFSDGNPANYKGVVISSRGFVGINGGLTNPVATLDINGFAKLAILTAAPASPANGMIAIADGTTWNPLSNGKQTMVAYLGGTWRQIAAAA